MIVENMETVTISSKYQIVIPRKTRERVGLVAGEQMKMISYDGRIELIPVRPLRSLRGFVKGIDASVGREEDRV